MSVVSPVTGWLRSVAPRRENLRADLVAGLPNAISNVPDGMASGVLAGVSPVSGLYASAIGPLIGGFGSSTQLMVITTTSAASLAAGSGVAVVDEAHRAGALALLALLAGGFMVVAGVLRLGRYTRFVSHSVMLGFLTGVAANIIFGQLADLTGTSPTGDSRLGKAINVILHPGRIDVSSLLVGLAAMAILVGLASTPLKVVSPLIALVVPTAVVIVAGLDSVARVSDQGAIPTGFPLPELPAFGQLNTSILAGAAAVAAIVLVQGTGVAEAAPNSEGPSNANRDFTGQGAGNIAASLFRGMPVGGSVSSTALNKASGARSRWSVIFSGVWVLVILVAFSGLVGQVALPTLAAILIYAATTSLRPHELLTIVRSGPNSAVAVIGTFVATLFLPVAAAVGLGVVISLLLQLNQEAVDLAVVQLTTDAQGRFVESPPPARLASHEVIVLDVYGSLFYAGARTLQSHLPDPTGAVSPGVVLRLRGRTTFGSTFFRVVSDYAARLEAVGGRLYLAGLDPNVAERLERQSDPLTGPAHLYPATPVVGESTMAALADASTWQVRAAE